MNSQNVTINCLASNVTIHISYYKATKKQQHTKFLQYILMLPQRLTQHPLIPESHYCTTWVLESQNCPEQMVLLKIQMGCLQLASVYCNIQFY